MSNPFIEIWGSEIHTDPKQVSSIKKARSAATTPSSVDKDSMTAIFPGRTTPYEVSLSYCPCGSFRSNRGQRPCKHMYRLAMECGLFDVGFETGINKNCAQATLGEAVAELENLPDCCQLLIKERLCSDNDPCLYVWSEEYTPMLSSALIQMESPTAESINLFFTAKRIVNACEANSISVPSGLRTSSRKKTLIQWCLENAPDVFFSFSIAPEYHKKRRKIYSYLVRKYDWDYVGGDTYRYPRFSDNNYSDRKYRFKDDEITQLLDGSVKSYAQIYFCSLVEIYYMGAG